MNKGHQASNQNARHTRIFALALAQAPNSGGGLPQWGRTQIRVPGPEPPAGRPGCPQDRGWVPSRNGARTGPNTDNGSEGGLERVLETPGHVWHALWPTGTLCGPEGTHLTRYGAPGRPATRVPSPVRPRFAGSRSADPTHRSHVIYTNPYISFLIYGGSRRKGPTGACKGERCSWVVSLEHLAFGQVFQRLLAGPLRGIPLDPEQNRVRCLDTVVS